MPYIAIKAYPKDMEIKKKVVDEINEVFKRNWGCPPEAISISVEEVKPEDWEDKVVKPVIEPDDPKMMIRNGKKRY